jgi:hypothetical protein
MTHDDPRVSDGTLLYINLGVGMLTALANGAALAIALSGNAVQLVGKELEIVIWLLLGLTVAGASVVGIIQRREKKAILRFQSLAIALLATMLSVWGLGLVFGKLPESRTIWTFGYLTVVAVYAVYLALRSFKGSQFEAYLFYAKVLFLPLCVLVDAAAFLRVGGFLAS